MMILAFSPENRNRDSILRKIMILVLRMSPSRLLNHRRLHRHNINQKLFEEMYSQSIKQSQSRNIFPTGSVDGSYETATYNNILNQGSQDGVNPCK
ncbi:hypothetical protein RJT34_28176 [Clitoria ternatea]|uniref:Uncharacterized protein n=1 Tax=Clitoria ternatea TaxID=43366 RepID=A0AAN9FD10_CLITE